MNNAPEIAALLARKQEMERGSDMQAYATRGGSYQWLCEAVKILLLVELERQRERAGIEQ
jgi:hypothetical protein